MSTYIRQLLFFVSLIFYNKRFKISTRNFNSHFVIFPIKKYPEEFISKEKSCKKIDQLLSSISKIVGRRIGRGDRLNSLEFISDCIRADRFGDRLFGS